MYPKVKLPQGSPSVAELAASYKEHLQHRKASGNGSVTLAGWLQGTYPNVLNALTKAQLRRIEAAI